MADPVSPAIIGYLVSKLFDGVCDAAGRAIKCREECKSLQTRLKKIEKLITPACEHEKNGNSACKLWLTELKSLLEEAKVVTNQCLQESKCEKLKRASQFWHWKKLPNHVKSIDRRLQEHIENTNLVMLGIVLDPNDPKDFQPQQLPPNVMGHEEHFNKLKASILQSRAQSVHSKFGVHGRGGAGKTVLAKRLHNDEEIKATYGEHSIMWITVGNDARVSQLYERMAYLLNDHVYKNKYATQCLEDQRTYLWNVLAKKEVLLILDDVWKKQYDGHDMMYWLDIATAPKSATLITTRDSSILTRVQAKVEGVVELPEHESWELFRNYAFKDGCCPSNIPEQLARDVCKECGGLPLALTVIGSAMLEKVDERGWRCSLDYLKQSKPIPDSEADDELFGRLRLSYNELKDDETKICFLYFAAFPEDRAIPTDELVEIWTAEGLFGTLDVTDAKNKAMDHLEILVKKSLIEWISEEQTHVQVHDILRDVAMYIIEKAKPGECAFECYFQAGKELKSFPSVQSLQHVKRMSFMQSIIYKWPKKLYLPNLQVCLLSQYSSVQTIHQQPFGILLHLLSSMHGLQYLSLAGNAFHIGEEILDFKGLMNLAYLNLSRCLNVESLLVNMDELKCLIHLNLSWCTSMKRLPESIGELKCLTHLELRSCGSLKELPVSIGELKCLTHLNLTGCESLKELPVSIGELKCLTHLELRSCGSLKELPVSIGELKCLTHLNLTGSAWDLKELPVSIGELKCLTHLDLSWCGSLKELPMSIGELKCLTHLDLTGCGSLKELPVSIGELKCLTHLDLSMCGSLKELPVSIGELKCLTHLDLTGCASLKELHVSIGELKCLTHLNLTGCESLKELPMSIGELKCLTHLDLTGCESLKELPMSIGELKCLTHLHLSSCKSLENLPKSIDKLKHFINLDLRGCISLKELLESIGS
jgi:Leucine-rich repeat (LRR) protein